MDERDWLILQKLYEEKNITKVAQSLYISQPALTNRLQRIEKEFNVNIVTRGRRGVQFTPQGEYLAKTASDMISTMQRIKEHVLNLEDSLEGTLRLGVSTFFTDYILPHLLKLFKQQYPNIEFKVTTNFSSQIAHLIFDQEVHVSIVRGDFSWKAEKKLLFEESICIASTEKIKIEDLPNLPRIDYKTDPALKNTIDSWWTENFTQPPHISITVDKIDTCKKMVLNGLGYAIVPNMLFKGAENIYKIDLKKSDGKPILRKTWMLYHKDALELNIVKAFVEFIEDTNLLTFIED